MAKIAEPEVVFCEYNHIYDKSLSAECPYCKQIAERTNQFKNQIDATTRKGPRKRVFGRPATDSDDDATTLLSRSWAALTGRPASASRPEAEDEATELRRDDDDDSTVLRRDDDDDATVLRRHNDDDDDSTVLRRDDTRIIETTNNSNPSSIPLTIINQENSHLRNSQLIIRTDSDIPAEVDLAAEDPSPDIAVIPVIAEEPAPAEAESPAAVESVIPEDKEPPAVVEEIPTIQEEEVASEPVQARRKVIGWLVCTASDCDYGCSKELQEGDNYICFDPNGHLQIIHDHIEEASAEAVIYRDQLTGIFRIRPVQDTVRVNDRVPMGSTYLEPYSSIVFSSASVIFFPAVGVCGFEWRQ